MNKFRNRLRHLLPAAGVLSTIKNWLLTTLLVMAINRGSKTSEVKGKRRWLFLSLIIVAVLGISYAILRFSTNLEWFAQYGYLGAFLASLIASTTILFPVPSFFVVGAIAASPATNWAAVALLSSLGGALGESVSYLAGFSGAVIVHPSHVKWYNKAEDWMKRWGSTTIFIFALTPLPFDLAGMAAGALRFPYLKFILATIAGRLPRTFVGCYLAHLGWSKLSDLRQYVENIPWWGWTLIGLGVVLILFFIGILWWIRRRRRTLNNGADDASDSEPSPPV